MASLAAPLRLLRGTDAPRTGATGTIPSATGATGTTAGPTAGPAATASGAPAKTAAASNGFPIAKVSDLANTSAVAFQIPADAPAPYVPLDPAVIVKLKDGSFVAYDAVCTHQGCTVEWDGQDSVLFCPCHGAAFDPAAKAQVLQGPTRTPLTSLPLTVNTATGEILLRA